MTYDIFIIHFLFTFTVRFSSPCSSKCLPTAKLIDTEVINRYIRMGSISSSKIHKYFIFVY